MYLKIGEEIGVLVLKISNVSSLFCPFLPNFILNIELLVKTEALEYNADSYHSYVGLLSVYQDDILQAGRFLTIRRQIFNKIRPGFDE